MNGTDTRLLFIHCSESNGARKPTLWYDLKVLMLSLFLLISFVNVSSKCFLIASQISTIDTSCQFLKEKFVILLLTSFIANIKIET